MPLLIYNSLTRKKEPFEPLDPEGKHVTIYNCGPTVYGRFHIGNARNFVVMDLVRRYLEEWLDYEVTFVQNLTDIDDKIIARANEEGRSTDDVAREFTDAYFEDVEKLGVRPADAHPKATEYVDRMIEFMEELEEKELAYPAGGSLYFRVRRFDGYGKLGHRNIDELLEGARVEVNEEKEDPLDFVLWKASKPGEPKWPSPWGEGRPGWHTECAVMTRAILGETIDIHSGGSDLQFPHHENEIAQREALSGKPFARYWMHNGFLNMGGEKMSKSLGNIMKIDDVLRHYPAEAVRYFFFSAHYRQMLDYNEHALEEAKSAAARINDGLETAGKILKLEGRASNGDRWERDDERTRGFIDEFRAAMNDDFNTAKAVAVLHEIVSRIHEVRQEAKPDYDLLAALQGAGEELRRFFGLEPTRSEANGPEDEQAGPPRILELLARVYRDAQEPAIDEVLQLIRDRFSGSQIDALQDGRAVDWESVGGEERRSEIIELLIEVRNLARQKKAFALADAIRDGLAEAGIALEDHPQGTIWKG